MISFLHPLRALHGRGVLGINQRNAGYVLPENPRRHYPRVDDKLLKKRLGEAAGIPTPEPLGVVSYHHELRSLPALLAPLSQFVLKPGRGAQGNGIIVIDEVEGESYRKANGSRLNAQEIRQHVSNMISGVFSLRGDWDSCLIDRKSVV